MEAIQETEGIAMEEMDARMKIDENAMRSDWKRWMTMVSLWKRGARGGSGGDARGGST